MKLIHIAVTCFSIVMISCASTAKKTSKKLEEVRVVERKVQVVERKLDDKSKAYIDSAINALKAIPQIERRKEDVLAIRLLSDTQDIIGLPTNSLKLDANLLLNMDETEHLRLKHFEEEHKKLVVERAKLDEQLDKLKFDFITEATKLANEQQLSFLGKIKAQLMEGLTIAGIGLLVLLSIIYVPKIIKRFNR